MISMREVEEALRLAFGRRNVRPGRRLICQGEVRPGLVVPPFWCNDPDVTYSHSIEMEPPLTVVTGNLDLSLPKPSYYVDGPFGRQPVYRVGDK